MVMAMREKLIEVLKGNATCLSMGIDSCESCPYGHDEDCYTSALVDHLIANGVTISKMETVATDNNVGHKWIPVTERLPENIGLFLVIEKHWIDGSPCRRIAKWNTQDWFTADRKSKEITPRVTHWMPLPEPPKEVNGND